MLQLLAGRMLEGENLAALRIDAAHDVLDGAVLAGRVHRLKDEQDRMGVRRVEFILSRGQGVNVLRQLLLGELLAFRLGDLLVAGPRRIVVLETELLAGRNAHGVENVFECNHDGEAG